jgi:hypothetical protein
MVMPAGSGQIDSHTLERGLMHQTTVVTRAILWALVVGLMTTCGDLSLPVVPSQRFMGSVYPEVWSSNAFDGQSFEFKSNCGSGFKELETCFLWTATTVVVQGPDGTQFQLGKDFNINAYSGEVTRRWVLYGPVGAGLMPAGDYRFLYYQGEELVLTQIVSYIPQTVGYPMDIVWTREGADLAIQWTPPVATHADMWYKVLLFPNGGNVISEIVPWDASSARLPNIPLADGARGTINVAIFFRGGYASSQYLPFTW